ncbi:MAG: MaoC domain protein dehydratase [Thermotoga sp. 50_1627]|uniref:MaoC family dehydratase n=1 Tax=Pseudothermotoga sp. TaxID=2033661 RepID=UPI00076DD464|nr:MAG: MaoC domain protein dehydratase [Thermotoga sp. 50_64]KUK25261.1 MAG: MaoC domain protein dehydratase [Thermotoga sp. 50_1627]MBC7116293.1 MaoC family dehydratase [Pseudothermotoga sp.]MDK2922710.1 3-hydroxybutyryl-CoA dehydratase [Pseudothermotoga sp.]HBT38683.1 enoyl-CoA hydratase [Pseudothermotoga sp.]
MKLSDVQIGQEYAVSFTISDEMVKTFAEITGDKNPVHLDEEYAKNTRFKKRICHGMLVASMISKVLGMDFPGPGTILVRQQLSYRAPVFVGETVEVRVTVTDKKEEKQRLILQTNVFKSDGTLAIEGQAEVLVER